ncbi:hypothetical protein L843_1825 [Mycobacterium intracellulare MIN_061107_1834]|nr:hypothetical protein L843_1825 [Mycobacterium intracellulare MIN_061107_1834]
MEPGAARVRDANGGALSRISTRLLGTLLLGYPANGGRAITVGRIP